MMLTLCHSLVAQIRFVNWLTFAVRHLIVVSCFAVLLFSELKVKQNKELGLQNIVIKYIKHI